MNDVRLGSKTTWLAGAAILLLAASGLVPTPTTATPAAPTVPPLVPSHGPAHLTAAMLAAEPCHPVVLLYATSTLTVPGVRECMTARQVAGTQAGVTQSNLLYGATPTTVCTVLIWITTSHSQWLGAPCNPAAAPTDPLALPACNGLWLAQEPRMNLCGNAIQGPAGDQTCLTALVTCLALLTQTKTTTTVCPPPSYYHGPDYCQEIANIESYVGQYTACLDDTGGPCLRSCPDSHQVGYVIDGINACINTSVCHGPNGSCVEQCPGSQTGYIVDGVDGCVDTSALLQAVLATARQWVDYACPGGTQSINTGSAGACGVQACNDNGCISQVAQELTWLASYINGWINTLCPGGIGGNGGGQVCGINAQPCGPNYDQGACAPCGPHYDSGVCATTCPNVLEGPYCTDLQSFEASMLAIASQDCGGSTCSTPQESLAMNWPEGPTFDANQYVQTTDYPPTITPPASVEKPQLSTHCNTTETNRACELVIIPGYAGVNPPQEDDLSYFDGAAKMFRDVGYTVHKVSFYGGECGADIHAENAGPSIGVYNGGDPHTMWAKTGNWNTPTDHPSPYAGCASGSTGVHDRNTGIQHLAFHLAWGLYNTFGGTTPIDVVAHSMGGLMIRLALHQIEIGDPQWPPALDVESIIDYSTPHNGARGACDLWSSHTGFYEMRQFCSWSGELNYLRDNAQNPQGTLGTRWILVGSDVDEIVTANSAVDMVNTHAYVYWHRPPGAQRGDQVESCSNYGHSGYFADTGTSVDSCFVYDFSGAPNMFDGRDTTFRDPAVRALELGVKESLNQA